MVSEKELMQYTQSLEVAGGRAFAMAFYHHCQFLNGSGDATMCIAFMINEQKMIVRWGGKEKIKLMKNDLWFECPAKDIEEKMGISKRKRRTAIKLLERKGVIETKHSFGNNQWVKIKPAGLAKMNQHGLLLEEDAPEKQKSGFPTSDRSDETTLQKSRNDTSHEKSRNDTSHLRRKKDKHCRSQARDGVPSTLGFGIVKERKSKAKDLTKRLHALLLKHNKVMRKVNPSQWEKRFAELIGLVDDVKQIDEVMTWYSRHIGKRYVPRVYSAEAFLEKYNQLVDAMERWQESNPSDDDSDSEIKAKRTVLPNGRIRVEY